jgi:hypothetical protein
MSRFNSEKFMKKEIQSILSLTQCQILIKEIVTRKRAKISYDKYVKLERIVVNEYFIRHPEIDYKKWSAWPIANSIKETLLETIHASKIIILKPAEMEPPHPFQSTKTGIKKIIAIENKIKLEKKLKKI